MELIQYVLNILNEAPYHCVFVILYLCGLGLPIPEEVTLIAAAVWSTDKQWPQVYAMFGVAMTAIILGDLTTYTIGRFFGYRLVRLPYFRRILSEDRLRKVDSFFDRYGDWAVLVARFFAGFRLACYFIAGITRLRVHIFLFMDFFAAILSAGLTFWIIRRFKEHIERGILLVKQAYHVLIGVVILSAVIYFTARYFWRRSKQKAAL